MFVSFAEHEMGMNRCDISFPRQTKRPKSLKFLNISGRIINLKSHKQHAIQCNFVIATNIIEKKLLKNWQIHIDATLRIAHDDGFD